MFSVFDDIALLGKNASAFLTGRGASMVAVALAAPLVPSVSLPVVGLAVGLPVTISAATMTHNYREQKITNNFRDEIASHFGIHREDVTPDHLRALAFGDEHMGIPPQPFFKEVLEHNDKNRWASIGATLAAGALTIGFVLTGAAATAASAVAALPVVGAAIGAFALPAVAGTMMFAATRAFDAVGQNLIDNTKRTAYEKLETIARQKAKNINVTSEQDSGIRISEDQVMSLIASVDPQVKQDIIDQYGMNYTLLPEDARRTILQRYNDAFSVEQITQGINNGSIKVNELAFVSAGMRSGLPDQPPHTYDRKALPEGLVDKAKYAKSLFDERIEERGMAQALLGDSEMDMDPLATQRTSDKSFVSRYTDGAPHDKTMSHAQRIEQRATHEGTRTLQ